MNIMRIASTDQDSKPVISLIVAMAKNRVIGKDNAMPWHIPEDFKYFKETTMGRPIVMGRKTYESLGRLLPGRENRIVTRQKDYRVEGAQVFHSLEEACRGQGEIFVIGGAEIYQAAMSMADRIYITLVDREFEGDAVFPSWPEKQFREISRKTSLPSAQRDFGVTWVVLQKV